MPLRGSIWRCRGSLWRSLPTLSTAFPIVSPIGNSVRPFAFPPYLCLYACVPAGTWVGRLAGRRADRFACKGKGLFQRLYPFAVAWQHLALSWQLVAFFGHPFHRFPYCFANWNSIHPLPFHHAFACMPVCRQAYRQASGQAGEPAGEQECLPVCGYIGYRLQIGRTLFHLWVMPPRGLLNIFLPLLSNSSFV